MISDGRRRNFPLWQNLPRLRPKLRAGHAPPPRTEILRVSGSRAMVDFC
jgi:hypothetical protein